jgi:homoserine O-acetyltransferase
VVGPGKPVDTDRFFVICANVLGGCMGSTGPREDDGRNGGPPLGYGFPQRHHPGHGEGAEDAGRPWASPPAGVIGGSMGGMQVLEWAATFPDGLRRRADRHRAAPFAQNIAFHEVGRAAIHADPDWKGGRYWEDGRIPARGLSVARMMAHITYLSEQALSRKFGRRLQGASALTFLEDVFQVESYLRHQGSTFVRRFDANSYLTITRAMDYFDLSAEHGSWPRPSRARRRASSWPASIATGCSPPARAAPWCAR